MSLATQPGIDNYAAIAVSKNPIAGDVHSIGLRPNRFQNAQLVMKTVSIHRIEGMVSGTSKFKFVLQYRSRSKHWNLTLRTFDGTSRQDAIELLDHHQVRMLQPVPPPGRRNMAYGYSVKRYTAPKTFGAKSIENFKSAVKARLFHTAFVTWCKRNNVGCNFRF